MLGLSNRTQIYFTPSMWLCFTWYNHSSNIVYCRTKFWTICTNVVQRCLTSDHPNKASHGALPTLHTKTLGANELASHLCILMKRRCKDEQSTMQSMTVRVSPMSDCEVFMSTSRSLQMNSVTCNLLLLKCSFCPYNSKELHLSILIHAICTPSCKPSEMKAQVKSLIPESTFPLHGHTLSVP